ncbi:MAG: DUF1003 domain-containing protein [Acidimicrobiales bacterium]
MRRREDLSTPRRGLRVGVHYDPDAFGRFSESIARLIGTARFLVLQTVVVIVWIALNAAVPGLRFDEYPFILLTLALSLQAAYAAPLILLAQSRQESRDREQSEQDREQSARTLADTEYLARELASIRLALSDVVTNADLERTLQRALSALNPRLDPDG